jgi:hypothetical protein
MLSLPELQRRFVVALVPGAPAPDPALLALIRGRGALDAAARLGIYADMYRARLLDVLREDFPRTLAVLGGARFDALAEGYLARHPSRHPSVRHLGHAFADDLAVTASAPPWVADLARLEWARVEVFDAPDPEPLRLADLAAVPPADWSELRFTLSAACRLLECAWPVHAIWAAAENDPAGAVALASAAAPLTVRVWREGWSVSHVAMGAGEARALRAVQRGETFAEVCAALAREGEGEAVAGEAAGDDAAREAGGLLLRWLEDGLLARQTGAQR